MSLLSHRILNLPQALLLSKEKRQGKNTTVYGASLLNTKDVIYIKRESTFLSLNYERNLSL